jgi:hypothetical protein
VLAGGGVLHAGRSEGHIGRRILVTGGGGGVFGDRLGLLLGRHALLSQLNRSDCIISAHLSTHLAYPF